MQENGVTAALKVFRDAMTKQQQAKALEKSQLQGVKAGQADIIEKTMPTPMPTTPQETSKSRFSYKDAKGNDLTSNDITFRSAQPGEKLGIQGITVTDKKGNRRRMYLVVPERESVGYGNIRGWGSPDDSNLPASKAIVNAVVDAGEKSSEGARTVAQGAIGTGIIPAAAIDLVVGNTISNNVTKNAKSKYTGEDKVVGLGKSGQSAGQILGMVDDTGEIVNSQEAKAFFDNFKKNGFVSIEDIESPEFEQEHTGPAYVPGDILLGLLGLQPNRGSVGYKFQEPKNHKEFQEFLQKLNKQYYER